jgi:Domain of unknown function (DUF4382)
MGLPREFTLPALVLVLAACIPGCSSSQEKSAHGVFAVGLAVSRAGVPSPGDGAASSDPLAGLRAADVTISEIEARKAGGTWVPVEGGLPPAIDLLGLASVGGTMTLPANLLPEGQYHSLHLRIAKVDLIRADGTHEAMSPPGAGWAIVVPVDFGVATGQSTIVDLGVRLDQSLKLVNGVFEFDPDVEVEGVEHD